MTATAMTVAIPVTVSATATMRTANEAAETADFVNREYLGHGR